MNNHMHHIEDLILADSDYYSGWKTLRFLKEPVKVTTKFDGSPSIFAGYDPKDDRFFVAKKSIFNKTPVVYKSCQDIDEHIKNPNLANIFKIALKEFPHLGIKNVIQGDVLFIDKTRNFEWIDSSPHITFQPNVLKYAFKTSEQPKIGKAKIGVAWHTEYDCETLYDLKAKYAFDSGTLNDCESIWCCPVQTQIKLSTNEQIQLDALMMRASSLLESIPISLLSKIRNSDVGSGLIKYYNHLIRNGKSFEPKHFQSFSMYLLDPFDEMIEKVNTRVDWKARKSELAAILLDKNQSAFENLFEFQKTIIAAKLLIINNVNRSKDYRVFVNSKTVGVSETHDEGYVLSTYDRSEAVKLVDRLKFSFYNFSPDIVKGW